MDAVFAGQKNHAEPCLESQDAVQVTFTGTGPDGDSGLGLGALIDPSCRTTTTGGVTAPLPGRVLELFRDTGLASVLSELIGPLG